MRNEDLQEFIDRLNSGKYQDTIFLRQISEFVFISKVRNKKIDIKDKPKFSHNYYTFFFIKNENNKFIGAVEDRNSDLHWYINKVSRKKGYLVRALKNAILPYIFYDENKDLESQRITITESEIGELNYNNSKKVALSLGFKPINEQKSEFILNRNDFDWSEEKLEEINTNLNDDKLNEFRKRLSYIYQDFESITNELLMAYGNQYEIENLIELSKKICYSKATIEDIIWENNEKNNVG